jgi:hypothetical protein
MPHAGEIEMPKLTEKLIAGLKPREGKKQFDVYCSKGLGLCYSNGGALGQDYGQGAAKIISRGFL